MSAFRCRHPTPDTYRRKQIITPTSVDIWGRKHDIPVLSFTTHHEKPWLYENEDDVVNTLSACKPDLLISACYGQKIPSETIRGTQFGALNVHPSLLPRWRGADPVPWTLITGDKQTGVTIVTISNSFDKGNIIAQKKIAVTEKDFSDTLRTTLFTYGADLLMTSLPDYLSGKNKGKPQKKENETYARKLTRQDGFIPWEYIQSAMEGNDIEKTKRIGISQHVTCHMSHVALRMLRAFSPWPGVWTLLRPDVRRDYGGQASSEKRVKILMAHEENGKLILDTVQLEGKKPVTWKQFESSYNKR